MALPSLFIDLALSRRLIEASIIIMMNALAYKELTTSILFCLKAYSYLKALYESLH